VPLFFLLLRKANHFIHKVAPGCQGSALSSFSFVFYHFYRDLLSSYIYIYLYSSDTHFYLIYIRIIWFSLSLVLSRWLIRISTGFFIIWLFVCWAHTHTRANWHSVRIWLETGWLCRINSKAIDSRQLSRPSRSFIQDTFDRSLSLYIRPAAQQQFSGCFYRDEWARIHVPFTFCWVCVCVETLLDTTTGGIERERRERFCFSFFFRLPWYGVNQFRFEMDYNLTLNWFDNERTHTHTCLGDAMITRSHSFGMCMMHVHFSLSHW
jgi:hypothetical protein